MPVKDKVVKQKKLQDLGGNLAVLIPKAWADELNWTQNKKIVLEYLPHRKIIILSENEETGNPIN